MSDPVDKHVISLEEKFKSQESELDDTGSSEELRDAPISPPVPFLENILMNDKEPQINFDAAHGDGSGNITVDLHGPRDMGLAHHDNQAIGENYNDFPNRSNTFLPNMETVETGYALELAPENRSPAPASLNTKPPGAPARRKRKRAEDPKTYVPLAVRERKQDEYYWNNF